MAIEVLTDPRHPKAAPQFICSGCQKKIAKTRDVYTLEGHDGMALCYRCMDETDGHARLYPSCPERWHDLWDHIGHFGTRAYVAVALGLWPVRR